MGSGKSTLGKKLATLLGIDFVDLDVYIEHQENKSVPEIFAAAGETHFRTLETEALRELSKGASKKIIALGGGSLMSTENAAIISNSGYLVYLQLPPAALFKRLQENSGDRPLLQNLNDSALKEKIADLLLQREPGYLRADVIVSALSLDAQKLRSAIAQKFLHAL